MAAPVSAGRRERRADAAADGAALQYDAHGPQTWSPLLPGRTQGDYGDTEKDVVVVTPLKVTWNRQVPVGPVGAKLDQDQYQYEAAL